MGIGPVEGRLNGGARGRNLRQSGNTRAVDGRNPDVRRIEVAFRQEGVGHDPVEVGALPRPGRPLVDAPLARHPRRDIIFAVGE